jgi:hypothetical protein
MHRWTPTGPPLLPLEEHVIPIMTLEIGRGSAAAAAASMMGSRPRPRNLAGNVKGGGTMLKKSLLGVSAGLGGRWWIDLDRGGDGEGETETDQMRGWMRRPRQTA